MIFSSIHFVFLFLPVVLLGYYILIHYGFWTTSKIWLVVSSLFFYGYWELSYLPIIISSIVFNYSFAKLIGANRQFSMPLTLIGILINLALLFYFKYLYFFDNEILSLVGVALSIENIILPLGISFFTFQQIAFLADIHKGYKVDVSFLNYSLFVCFFPQLIAGPIVHHAEMMPQFKAHAYDQERWKNLNRGLFVFAIGLFKKVVIADTLSTWVDWGFANTAVLSSSDAWYLSLAYTFQLYYDFSGYADMAIGIALMFNVRLPINFNAPYKAKNIQDFWRRWHMTLSRWFRDYVYIPLGGNKSGKYRTLFNIFFTAFVSGIWHGAGWTFVMWGTLHGAAMVIHRVWSETKIEINRKISVLVTFLFINVTWIFFRAEDTSDAYMILGKMFNLKQLGIEIFSTNVVAATLNSIELLLSLPMPSESSVFSSLYLVIMGLLILEVFKKSEKSNFVNDRIATKTWLTPILLTISYWFMSVETVEKFIYFNF